MNGGPGASSLIGAFTEMGQLLFNRDSKTLPGQPSRTCCSELQYESQNVLEVSIENAEIMEHCP